MAAIASAKLYHKIGASNKIFFNQDKLTYLFIGYLNVVINNKSYYHVTIFWKIWRIIYICYIFIKLGIIRHYPVNRLYKFVMLLIKVSDTKDCVDKEIFYQAKNFLE